MVGAVLIGSVVGHFTGARSSVAFGAQGDAPIVAARADQLLRDMGEYLAAAEAFTFHAEIAFDDRLPSGQKLQYGASADVAVRRPDRLYAEYQGDLGGKRFWYDGQSIALLDTAHRVYSTAPVPATVDQALDHAIERYGLTIPLADLLYSDPYGALMEQVRYGFYVGLHPVDGVRCHHLAFVQQLVEWQIWIEDGAQLVPRKVVITYKTQPGSPQYIALLSKWDFGVRPADRLFVADMPAGVEQIDFLELTETEQND
jgi:hypothetical protein